MIPVFKPYYDGTEIEYLRSVFESAWLGLGPKTKEFEKRFAELIGVEYAIGLNSATAALHLAFEYYKIAGKEVITTPITFVSTNHAILYNNGIPKFCDVEGDTMNIDAHKIEELITEKTAGIVVVHYGGRSCDMDHIKHIADRYNLFLIEDCSHATGGKFKDQPLGSIGNVGCFSFHAVKNLTTGDGGMITTRDKEINDRLLRTRWVGITKDTYERDLGRYSWYYDVIDIGYKYHMNDIIAAIGLAQLEKLEWMNNRRREISKRYDKELINIGDIQPLANKKYQFSAAHNYVIKTSRRDDLNEYLKKKGISTGVHYYPNHLYQLYKPYYRECPVAEKEWKKLLTLPLYPSLTEKEVDFIITEIKRFYNAK